MVNWQMAEPDDDQLEPALGQDDAEGPARLFERGVEYGGAHAVDVGGGYAPPAGHHLGHHAPGCRVGVLAEVVEEVVAEDALLVGVGDVEAFAAHDEGLYPPPLVALVLAAHPDGPFRVVLQVLAPEEVVEPLEREVAAEDAHLAAAPVVEGNGIGAEQHVGPRLVVVGLRPAAAVVLHALAVPVGGEVVVRGGAYLADLDLPVSPDGILLEPSALLGIVAGLEGCLEGQQLRVQLQLVDQGL